MLNQQQIIAEINLMPVNVKAQIIDSVLLDINSDSKDNNELWLQEILQRKQDIEDDTIALVDGDTVFKKLMQKFS